MPAESTRGRDGAGQHGGQGRLVELYDRLDFLPVAVGLFALAEILYNVYKPVRLEPIKARLSGLLPTRQD